MNHEELWNVLTFIKPNAEFTLSGDELIWLDKKESKPTEKEIADGFIAYKAKVEADKTKADAAKAAAEAKLAKLGLTPDDLKALGF